MKKKLIIIGVVIVLLSSGLFIAARIRNARSEKKTDRTEVVRRGPFEVRLKEIGRLESLVRVEVKSNVEGEIEKLYVDEGYDVVKGQELIKIDDMQIREEYKQAQANCDAAQAEMDRATESVTLSSDKLKSDIQLAMSDLKASQAKLESLKAQTTQQLAQSQLSITSLENLLEQDRISLKKAQLALEQAESSEKSAKAKLDNAKSELDRKKGLYEKKFVAQREVEMAQLEHSSALAQYESAQKSVASQRENVQSQNKIIENRDMNLKAERENLETLKQSLSEQKRQADIQIQQAQERLTLLQKSEEGEKRITELARKTAEANLIRARSALNNTKQRLGWTTIVAPITGRIVQCKVEEGELITSGRSAWSQSPPIMTIADLSKMIVKTQIHEVDISKVKVGQKAEIRVSSYRDEVFEGEVKEISPSAQLADNVIKFEVTVTVTKAPKPLLPGMTADVDIIVGERDNVLQLPIEAIIVREPTKVKTNIKREMLGRLRDQKVEVVVSNYPDKKFPGKVAEIAPEKPGLSYSEVTVSLEGSPKEFQTGTTRTVDIILPGGEKIPSLEARIESEKEYYVKIAKETGAKEKTMEEEKKIKVGDRTSNSIEILDGLKEGDKVRVVPVGEEEKKGAGKRKKTE